MEGIGVTGLTMRVLYQGKWKENIKEISQYSGQKLKLGSCSRGSVCENGPVRKINKGMQSSLVKSSDKESSELCYSVPLVAGFNLQRKWSSPRRQDG